MRDIVLLGGLLLLIPVILWRPFVGILAWTCIGLINPQDFSWGVARFFPVALVIAIPTLVGLPFAKERRNPPWCSETILMLFLAIWFTLTTTVAWSEALAWDQWFKMSKILLMTFVTTMLIFGREKVRFYFYTMGGSLAFFGVKGGLFTLLSGGQHRVQGPGGFLSGNTEIGLALVMGLPLIATMAQEQRRAWVRNLGWAAFWLTSIAVVFTYSRGALLGLAPVLLLVIFRSRYRWVFLGLAVPVTLLALAVVPEQLIQRTQTIGTYEQDASAMGRLQAWGVAINIALSHPMGAGFNLDYVDVGRWISYANFLFEGAEYRIKSAHSIYFQVLGEHGFLGLALFLALILSTLFGLRQTKKRTKSSPEHAWIIEYATSIQIAIVGYAVSGAFLSLAYFDLFYALVAMSAILKREARDLENRRRSNTAVLEERSDRGLITGLQPRRGF